MSQEYYSLEKKSEIGNLNIGLQVFQSIASMAVNKVDNVELEGSGSIPLPGINKKSVRVNLNKNNQVTIDMDVIVDYGAPVSAVISELQKKVLSSIYEMTFINNVRVNIVVKEIKF